MIDDYRARAVTGHAPIHAFVSSIPVVCFTGALLTDIAYAKSAAIQWSNFSAWLLAVGLLFGVLALVLALIEHLVARRARAGAGWIHAVGSVIALILALFNNFIHGRDGWTSVVPTGLTLSVLTVLVMLATAIFGHVSNARYVEVRP